MIYVCLFLAALVVAVLFLFAAYYLANRSNELTKKKCGNCEMYDESMKTCWIRCEKRYPGDDGCDYFDLKEADCETPSQ